ncbi:MAG: threonylcarbamoyl-AMP synthase [Deltaproteobacteria bacterium]|nr:threonylcarbamoyl-AMP synthase [Deltaproteobacteria bacterium]
MNVLTLYDGLPKTRQLGQVVADLSNGALVIIPTDTNYAAVCSLDSKKGINQLYNLNTGRHEKKITLFCADLKNISLYASVNNPAYRLMKSLIPGPYTFILPASRMVPKMVLTKRRTVGIRTPDHPACLTIPSKLDTALLAVSVKDIATRSEDSVLSLESAFQNQTGYIFDAGNIDSESSTIIDMTGSESEIIRLGKGKL